ncbi:MAG: DNA methyltransferase, partial [Candidatus Hodarchaeales archaeon]
MTSTYTSNLINNYKDIIYKKVDLDPIAVTFQKNKKSPVHRWYPYKEGFSQSFVEKMFKEYNVDKNSRIVDPFAGSGTILVEAKKRGIFSAGYELNPFIHFLAKVKVNWDIDTHILEKKLKEISCRYDFLKTSKNKEKRFIQAKENCTIDPPNMNTL